MAKQLNPHDAQRVLLAIDSHTANQIWIDKQLTNNALIKLIELAPEWFIIIDKANAHILWDNKQEQRALKAIKELLNPTPKTITNIEDYQELMLQAAITGLKNINRDARELIEQSKNKQDGLNEAIEENKNQEETIVIRKGASVGFSEMLLRDIDSTNKPLRDTRPTEQETIDSFKHEWSKDKLKDIMQTLKDKGEISKEEHELLTPTKNIETDLRNQIAQDAMPELDQAYHDAYCEKCTDGFDENNHKENIIKDDQLTNDLLEDNMTQEDIQDLFGCP